MYKAPIRSLIRKNIAMLNAGDHGPLRRAAAPDAVLRFPGDNSLSRQFGRVSSGVDGAPTHIGTAELEAFAQRFVDAGLRIDVEDTLVNGPPWRTRIWIRGTDHAIDADGREVYANRLVACIDARWGVIQRWEDCLDTERIRAWEEGSAGPSTAATTRPGTRNPGDRPSVGEEAAR